MKWWNRMHRRGQMIEGICFAEGMAYDIPGWRCGPVYLIRRAGCDEPRAVFTATKIGAVHDLMARDWLSPFGSVRIS